MLDCFTTGEFTALSQNILYKCEKFEKARTFTALIMLGIWIPDINPKSALIWMPDKLVSCIKDIKTGLLQWGSEIRPIEIGTFWRSDFKWSGLRCGYSYSPNHSKTRPFKILPFLSGFQMLFDKMAYLITFWILDKNGALKKIGLVFRCPSKIGSLANQTFFTPFEDHTCLLFWS